MKILVFFSLLCVSFASAQFHVDVLKFSYGNTVGTEYVDNVEADAIHNFKASITYPLKLSEDSALLLGLNANNTGVRLDPNYGTTALNSVTVKLGYTAWHNNSWGSSVILLPKIASTFEAIDGQDFYIGGIALANYKNRDDLIYRFGVYGSTEPFGTVITPIVGLYYLSPRNKFQADIKLPIAADLTYMMDAFSLGFSYSATNTGFNLKEDTSINSIPVYVQNRSIEFGPYLRKGFLDDSLLIDLKVGYTNNNYQLYEQGDKSGLNLFTFDSDDRNRLLENRDFKGSLFAQIGATYRVYTD